MINILKEIGIILRTPRKESNISLETVASRLSTVFSLKNGDTIINLYDITNTFSYYFTSIAETTKISIKYSYKYFSDYLSNESSCTIFLQPTDKEELANIIFSLNSNKASGQNSIPYRILFLLKNEIWKQLADLFNLSFMAGVFPSVLKTAKVVPVFKKYSKLDYSDYRLIYLLPNTEKIIEKLMYILKKLLKNLCIRDCILFLIRIMLSTSYSLDSDNSILHLMPD